MPRRREVHDLWPRRHVVSTVRDPCLILPAFSANHLGRFNWAARKLVRRLQYLGASEFFPSGEADERHDDG